MAYPAYCIWMRFPQYVDVQHVLALWFVRKTGVDIALLWVGLKTPPFPLFQETLIAPKSPDFVESDPGILLSIPFNSVGLLPAKTVRLCDMGVNFAKSLEPIAKIMDSPQYFFFDSNKFTMLEIVGPPSSGKAAHDVVFPIETKRIISISVFASVMVRLMSPIPDSTGERRRDSRLVRNC